MTRRRILYTRVILFICVVGLALAMVAGSLRGSIMHPTQTAHATGVIEQAFDQASQQFGVPVAILKALCEMEGHLSNHGGSPSIDGGYGCMHLVKNNIHVLLHRGAGKDQGIGTNLIKNGQVDTLDSAAHDLSVTPEQLKTDMATNIRGGAAVLRDTALQISANHTLPTTLADWYGAVAAYSHATTQSVASMYADEVYKLINSGFSGTTDSGEVITLAPQQVTPNVATAANVKATSSLPQGCVRDNKTDYPGAIDCIVPTTFDCNLVPDNAPCTYIGANRPSDLSINFIAIHDIEGTAVDGIDTFQNVNSGVSIHYVVDTDGTVYQLLHEKDVAFHVGNFWYNQHSIGIEHAGFDATGYLWYNAAEYLGSARLVAYLVKKYHIPVDHDHIVSHGTVPSPSLPTSPNHVDPGPYWLWDYYFNLISRQDVTDAMDWRNAHIISIHPSTGMRPLGQDGKETPANFNFFYLYNGPSTKSGLIPPEAAASDVTAETINVESDISYYYLARVKDPAGSGDTMYEIWYGEQAHYYDPTPDYSASAKLVWLAVPPNAARIGSKGTAVVLHPSGGIQVEIYGRPTSSAADQIGVAPSGSIFVSMFTVIEDGTTNLWYEINYNHRQAWVPATEVLAAPQQNG